MPVCRPAVVLLLLCVVALVDCLLPHNTSTSHQQPANGNNVMVGINYFAGWWTGPGDKWMRGGKNWQSEYPKRVPLLGSYITQSTVDQEIDAASQYKIDFFQMLYYDNYPSEREPGSKALNNGIKYFQSSTNSHKMKFFISWCNTLPTYAVHNESEWEEMIHKDWLPAFHHPSYLRIGGALVFKILNAPSFLDNCNKNASLVQQRWQVLRDAVRAAGLGEVLLGAGLPPRFLLTDPQTQVGYSGYNFTSLYGQVAPGETGKVYPWSVESADVLQWRHKHATTDSIPFVPMVMSGWDSRPWAEKRPSFVWPTDAEWRSELLQVLKDLDNYSSTGFPLPNGGRQKVFNIYAWNEFGEGGIMAPSQGWKYTRLQAVMDVVKS